MTQGGSLIAGLEFSFIAVKLTPTIAYSTNFLATLVACCALESTSNQQTELCSWNINRLACKPYK